MLSLLRVNTDRSEKLVLVGNSKLILEAITPVVLVS